MWVDYSSFNVMVSVTIIPSAHSSSSSSFEAFFCLLLPEVDALDLFRFFSMVGEELCLLLLLPLLLRASESPWSFKYTAHSLVNSTYRLLDNMYFICTVCIFCVRTYIQHNTRRVYQPGVCTNQECVLTRSVY